MRGQCCQTKKSYLAERQEVAAFSLIELLVVIAVIAVLAGLLLPAGAAASRKMKISRVQGELNRLATRIETYKMEVGEYPLDHGNLVTYTNEPGKSAVEDTNYYHYSGWSPLYYELSGATFENTGNGGLFRVSSTEAIRDVHLNQYFNVKGIRNSARNRSDIPYKAPAFKASEFAEVNTGPGGPDVELLVVPVPNGPLPAEIQISGKTTPVLNPWRYDRSSPRRNNLNSFDLWADIRVGKNQIRVSNWSK